MRLLSRWRFVAALSVLTLTAWGVGHPGRLFAREQAATTRTAREGTLAKTSRHQFEVFFYSTGVRVFPLDSMGSPIDVSKLNGTATFYHPNSPQPWFSRPIRAGSATGGQAPTSLDLAIGLETVPATGSKVAFEVVGLTDPMEQSASFTVPVGFVKPPSESTSTLPVAPVTATATSPRYVYGLGYYGYGYYAYPGPEAAPAQAAGPAIYGYGAQTQSSQSGYSSDTVGPGHRDWSTDRSNGLAKPWMKSMD